MGRFMSRSLVATGVLLAIGGYIYQSDQPIDAHQMQLPEKFQAKLEKKLINKAKYGKPSEAAEFFNSKRMPIGMNQLPVEKYDIARSYMQKQPHYDLAAQSFVQPQENGLYASSVNASDEVDRWEQLGPGNVGGRTRAILFHPTTPDTMFTAGVSGGVWKTTDAGDNWQPLDDLMTHLAVTTLNFEPGNPDVIYAGTGEGFRYTGIMRGNGIFVSSDAGTSWNSIASTVNNPDFNFIYRIAVSHNNPKTMYVASNGGLFKTENAGSDWTKLIDAANFSVEAGDRTFPIGCLDIELRTDKDVDYLVAACGNHSAPSQVLVSKDAGATWTTTIDSLVEGNEDFGRIEVALSPSNQDSVYALIVDVNTNALHSLFRSMDGGDTWTKQVGRDTAPEDAPIARSMLGYTYGDGVVNQQCWGGSSDIGTGQGWYDLTLAVDPSDAERVWVGGVDVLRSDNGGKNFGIASQWWLDPSDERYIHADNHIIAFHPDYDGSTNKTMYIGNEGGVQRTLDAQGNVFAVVSDMCHLMYSTWYDDESIGYAQEEYIKFENMNNGYAVTQFYHGGAASDGSKYAAGSQDNGTQMGTVEGGQTWTEIRGGDGGYTSIDPTNSDIIYSSYVYNSLQVSYDSGASWSNASVNFGGNEADTGFRFITPHILDNNNPDRLWTGGNYIWRTNDKGQTWERASEIMPEGSAITAFGIANGDSNNVLVGTSRGFIVRSQEAGQTDKDTQWHPAQPVLGNVSSVTFDPNNSQIVYATYSTFGVNHVWKSENGGISWKSIDNLNENNGIPDIPVHTIVVDPSDSKRLYVGTDLGLFVSFDGGDNWVVENTDFANVMTEHLTIVDNQLYAFTHGRGVFRVQLGKLPQTQLQDHKLEVEEDVTFAMTQTLISDDIINDESISHVYIESLPTKGTLTLSDVALEQGQHITLDDLDKVRYTPEAHYFGNDEFFLRGSDGTANKTTKGRFEFNIKPVNDAPEFTLSQNNFTLEQDFSEATSVSVIQGLVPENEKNQVVNYAIYPESSSIVDVIFDKETGSVSFNSIEGKHGNVSFTIVADDGQTANDTFSQNIDIIVEKRVELEEQKLEVNEDTTFTMSQSLITNDESITHVYVESLPSKGVLTLDDVEVAQGQHISLTDFDNVIYTPQEHYFGDDELFFRGSDGTSHNTPEARFEFDIQSINDAPEFSLSQNSLSLKQDFSSASTISVTPSDVPENEKSQVVSYSISPESSSLVSVSFNKETGSVSLSSIKGEHGNATFTIQADDGQDANSTMSQSINVTVDKKKSSGGTFGFLLIALAGLFGRRLKK